MNNNKTLFDMAKRYLAISFIALLPLTSIFAQTPLESKKNVLSPTQVVQAYVDAANRNDLEAFLALYSPSIKKYRFPATLASEGIEHMRKVYTKSFAEKTGIHVEVISMIALGDKVMCYDYVTGLPNAGEAYETVVYQVENGLITNIVYVDRITKHRGE